MNEKEIMKKPYFDLACIICEKAFMSNELKPHYTNDHTLEELIDEACEVSRCLALFGEYT